MENSIKIMTKLGSLHNYISFENLNKDTIESQKPYYSMIQRCEELEKILEYLNKVLCEEFNLNYEKYKNYEYFKIHLDEDILLKEKKFNENYFDLIEVFPPKVFYSINFFLLKALKNHFLKF